MRVILSLVFTLVVSSLSYGQVYDFSKHGRSSLDNYSSGGSRSVEPKRQPLADLRANRFDSNSLSNPYGAGNPYRSDGLMNPYSRYGNPYSNESWRNPYATSPPVLVEGSGRFMGELSTNPYRPNSVWNSYGRYGNPFSPESFTNPYGSMNPFGAANPYSPTPLYVLPGRESDWD